MLYTVYIDKMKLFFTLLKITFHNLKKHVAGSQLAGKQLVWLCLKAKIPNLV